MNERVFEDDRSISVSYRNCSVEFYVFHKTLARDTYSEVEITVCEDAGYNSQTARFIITSEEATRLKEFLISKGY